MFVREANDLCDVRSELRLAFRILKEDLKEFTDASYSMLITPSFQNMRALKGRHAFFVGSTKIAPGVIDHVESWSHEAHFFLRDGVRMRHVVLGKIPRIYCLSTGHIIFEFMVQKGISYVFVFPKGENPVHLEMN